MHEPDTAALINSTIRRVVEYIDSVLEATLSVVSSERVVAVERFMRVLDFLAVRSVARGGKDSHVALRWNAYADVLGERLTPEDLRIFVEREIEHQDARGRSP